LRALHSLFCSSAKSNQLLHTRLTLAPVRNASFPLSGRSTSAPLTRMRLLPVRHPLNRNRRHSRLERPGSGSAKGPYYVDFRARTAASWGHAFVWFGKTNEREVEVAGLTPAGDTLAYVVGYLTWVPSDTGASYGDLDPQYLTASYRVYLNEPDAKRVFAYIKKLQASSPVWNAEISNCTAFIGDIANFMGLKVPSRWQRPEDYVNSLKALNGGRQMVHLSSEQ